MLPVIIRKILNIQEQLLRVPFLTEITNRLSSEYLDDHSSPDASRFGAGSAENAGHVKISNSISSRQGTGDATAATPYAVKIAYDEGHLIDCLVTEETEDGLPKMPSNLRSGGIIIHKQ